MGNSESVLTQEKITELSRSTHFSVKEIQRLILYYSEFDKSVNGQDGVAMAELSNMTVLSACPFYERIAYAYMDRPAMRLRAEPFLKMFSVLSSRASVQEKTKALFDCLDCSQDGTLGFDELFRFYKSVLSPTIDDNRIVDLVVQLLEKEGHKDPHRLNYRQFQKLISEEEIMEKMTVDLQLKS